MKHRYWISGIFKSEDESPCTVPAGDIEQVVADVESKLDEMTGDCDPGVIGALLWRLRVLAGLDTSEWECSYKRVTPGEVEPMTIGRRDVCLISTPHDVTFCGKKEAHR